MLIAASVMNNVVGGRHVRDEHGLMRLEVERVLTSYAMNSSVRLLISSSPDPRISSTACAASSPSDASTTSNREISGRASVRPPLFWQPADQRQHDDADFRRSIVPRSELSSQG